MDIGIGMFVLSSGALWIIVHYIKLNGGTIDKSGIMGYDLNFCTTNDKDLNIFIFPFVMKTNSRIGKTSQGQ